MLLNVHSVEDKSCLISSTSAPTVSNVLFVLFYCCHCAVFFEWPDRALSRILRFTVTCQAYLNNARLFLCFDGLFCSV